MYAATLQIARHHKDGYHDERQSEYDGIGKACQIVADIEDERRSDEDTRHDGKEQRQTVDAVARPQRLELVAVVVLHHNGAQEGRDEYHRDQAAHAVGPPVGQYLPDEGQEEGKHEGDGGGAEDAVDERRGEQLAHQQSPVAALHRTRVGGKTQMAQPPEPPLGQPFLQLMVGGVGSLNHIRCKEGGDDRYRHHDRIEEVADDVERESQ